MFETETQTIKLVLINKFISKAVFEELSEVHTESGSGVVFKFLTFYLSVVTVTLDPVTFRSLA